jgi:SAM-dependent methyltransferase
MTRLSALIPGPVRPLARTIRNAIRGADRTPMTRPLSMEECRHLLEPQEFNLLLEQKQRSKTLIKIHNPSTAIWSSFGSHPVQLVGRWLTGKKEPLEVATLRLSLPEPIHPGSVGVVAVELEAPEFLGHFMIQWDLVQEGGPSTFRQPDQKPLYVEVQVTGRAADDIDYYKVYATADLSKDFWTVVGPSTREEFERLAQIKLKQLQEIGLNENSHVLDIGCGTGQLAVSLEKYLSEQGSYFGTDIGPEAIAYCHEHFKRKNFRFAVNEMTRIPCSGQKYDFITFFSVFTHTYPDETALLLAEAKRLLAPNGIIIGDVFTSHQVERCSGNRGAIELNRDHFLRLVELAGLNATVHASWPWQTHARREIYLYRHR